MALMYFDNRDYYRNLLSSAREENKKNDLEPDVEIENDTLDTMICARIRPLADEEEKEQHISGVLCSGPSKAELYEPRRKFNNKPDSVVRLGHSLTKALFVTDLILRNTNSPFIGYLMRICKQRVCIRKLPGN